MWSEQDSKELMKNDLEMNPRIKKEIKEWVEAINQSEEIIKNQESCWKRMLNYYKDEFHPFRFNDDRITVNYFYAYVETIIPQVYFKNPRITVTPKKVRNVANEDESTQKVVGMEEMLTKVSGIAGRNKPVTNDKVSPEQKANISEIVLNYLFDEKYIKTEIKKCIKDALIYGIGFAKTGYTFKKDLKAKKKEDGTIDYEERIKKDDVHVFRISPKQVVLPIGFDDLDKMPWIALKFIKPLDDVKNTKAYKNTEKLKGSKINNSDFYSLTRPLKKQESTEDFIMLYEIWDARNLEVITITKEGVELKRQDWPYDAEGFPIQDLRFNCIPDEYYPISPLKYIEAQVKELNLLRTRQQMHNRRFNRKYAVDTNKVDATQFQKLKKGEDGTIIGVTGDPRNAVSPIQDAPISADHRLLQEDAKQDIRIMLGLDDLQMGAGVRGAQSATEANIVEQNKRLRVDEKADVVQDFVNRIARFMLQLVMQFFDKSLIVRITGESSIPWERVLDKETIQGEYDVKIESGSTLPMTDDLRRQQLIQLTSLLGAPMFAQMIDWPAHLKKLLRSFPFRDLEEVVSTEESEREATVHASKENQLLFIGREVHPMPFEAHLAHIKEHARFLDSNQVNDDGGPEGIPPQSLPFFQAHMQEHMAMLQQVEMAVQRQGSPAGGSAPSPNAQQPQTLGSMPAVQPQASSPMTQEGV